MSQVRAGPAGGLLERSDELAGLAECLAAVEESGRGQVLLLGGEAGVGKTVMLEAFCDEHPRLCILRGACDPLFTPRPLGPLLGVAEETGGELEALVNAGALPYEVATALAGELSARAPSIFLLEDLHWADEATLDVLRLLVRRVESVPALVVASYRDDELDAVHPLRIVLGELATSSSISRMKLPGLSPTAVAELAEPYGADPDELYEKTAGNPFFVVEALAAGADVLPDTVRDAVLARAARLTPTGRALLEAVAIVPAHAELWLLDAIAGESVDGLDECLASGMLRSDSVGVSFRHELARLAVEESVPPQRMRELHRLALAALAKPPKGVPDLARLAHHAEAAGDTDAVLRYAPAAAARAAALGAHREAAAQYARALRFGGDLTEPERADFLDLRSRECYLTDQNDEAIESRQEELGLRRALGQRLMEARSLSNLSEILWCPGRTAEGQQAAREAVAILETLPPGHELARAWANSWSVPRATQALELANEIGDVDTAIRALYVIAISQFDQGGRETAEQCIEFAQEGGMVELAGMLYSSIAGVAVAARQYGVAAEYADRGTDYCSDRGLELFRFYVLGERARIELDQGRWADAADAAAVVLRIRRASILPRIYGLIVLGLVRARRGDPGYEDLLAEARALSDPTRELYRMRPVAAARAEIGWLEGKRDAVAAATDGLLALAVEQEDRNAFGELAVWRRRVGIDEEITFGAAEPYASQLAGDWAAAAGFWAAAGCPYEAALALADADEEEPLRQAHDELRLLGATPAASIVAGRLRELGVRDVPRGPRRTTRENPAGLTVREVEVLGLVAEGLRDSEIAARLVLSERTVGHHVSSILRKLGVRNRSQASVEAVRLGLAGQDR